MRYEIVVCRKKINLSRKRENSNDNLQTGTATGGIQHMGRKSIEFGFGSLNNIMRYDIAIYTVVSTKPQINRVHMGTNSIELGVGLFKKKKHHTNEMVLL